MYKIVIPFLLLLLLIIVVFHSWFSSGLLSSFDFPFYSQLMMKSAVLQLYAWDWHLGFDGFAGFFSPYSWVFPFIYMPQVIFGNLLGLDWAFIERVAYLYPLLILLIFSPVFFFKTIFPKNNFYLISVLIFSFNTYSLLLAGGEIFVALAYSLAPLIFALVIRIINKRNLLLSISAGLILAVQIMMDPRITYITMFAIGLYLLFNIGSQIKTIIRNRQLVNYKIIIYLLIPFITAGLLNAFWIIPTVLYGKNPVTTLGSAYSKTEAVEYLSFAKLEQTISLLQQNWPENIFGKVDFMKPEFLLLPVLAYASLLFLKSKDKNQKASLQLKAKKGDGNLTIEQFNNRTIIFFVSLGLIGSFLSKGANDPFGGIYLWMFSHVPGFIMFRDPAKWYPLVAISYSILIPFTTVKIFELLSKVKRFSIFNLQNIFLLSVIFYVLFLIRPALFGQLGGMFKTTKVPQEYIKLEKFLYNQPSFFRTLWLPSKQHFGYYSNTHPEISARTLFDMYDDDKLFKKFSDRRMEKLLQEASIKYVIVPYDSEKEIFLTDRKYDDKKYKETINKLQKIKWLIPISLPQNCELQNKNCEFGKIAVFKIQDSKDHFWTNSIQATINYKYINPTEYIVNIKKSKAGDTLVFSEKYDKWWTAKQLNNKGKTLINNKFNLYNSFTLLEKGNYSLIINYKPQKWVDIGVKISSITFILILSALGALLLRKS